MGLVRLGNICSPVPDIGGGYRHKGNRTLLCPIRSLFVQKMEKMFIKFA